LGPVVSRLAQGSTWVSLVCIDSHEA
jgi:hypothetical protein